MVAKNIGFIGLQTGDEGKGNGVDNLVDIISKRTEVISEERHPTIVWRYQGGGNAGHTIIIGEEKYKLHQVPSGILSPNTFNLTGAGCFFDPIKGMYEIRDLIIRGVDISPRNFGIASNAHVTLQYHTSQDRTNLERERHTSTGNGILQTAVDKAARMGIRFQEFLDEETFIEILRERRFPPSGAPPGYKSVEEFADQYEEAREFLAPFSVLQTAVLKKHGTHYVIAEGAQGFRLDMDEGLYPGVTSSNPGRLPFNADLTFGVVKLYESSVGSDRPFVGRMDPLLESRLRDIFGEYGTTTGKARDLGWFDAVAVRHAIETTDTDYLIGTCGDRLEALRPLGEKVKIVVGYKIGERTYHTWSPEFHNRRTLYEAKPIFEEMPSWNKFADEDGNLTNNAYRFVDRIQELTGKEFVMLGNGPAREQMIQLRDPLSL